jgi:hypothetical protein
VPPIALFLIFILLIAIVLFAVWRYWISLARVSPEEEEYDERMAALNERQANRISDEFLTHSLSDDDAWQIMVRRGKQVKTRRPRKQRATAQRALPPPRETPLRRERYGGEFARRVDERRDRFGDTSVERPRRPRRDD